MTEGLPDATAHVLDLICRRTAQTRWTPKSHPEGLPPLAAAIVADMEGITNECLLDLDVAYEVPPKEVANRLRGFPMVGKHDEANEVVRMAFAEGRYPAMTLFEICAMIGSLPLMERLQELAQQRLFRLIYSRLASIDEVLRLLRAGANPQRQHFQAWLLRRAFEEEPAEPKLKRARVEAPVTQLPSLPSGTALHWVCRVGVKLPRSRANHAVRYAEVASWLAEIAPFTLLLPDDKGRTPVQVVLANMPAEESGAGSTDAATSKPLCAFCGVRGHAGKDCPSIDDAAADGSEERYASVALSILKVLGERFLLVVDRYPWRLAALLGAGGGNFRKDLQQARDLLLTMSPLPTSAIEGFSQALDACAQVAEASESADCTRPSELAAEAAEHLGSLGAARSRARLLQSLNRSCRAESETMELQEVKAKLEESEAARRAEVIELEQRLEGAEAKLAEAQRRVEEAEAAAAAAAASVQPASIVSPGPVVKSNGSTSASSAAFASNGSSQQSFQEGTNTPEGFIAAIRRQRLVDLEHLEDAAPDVRAGVANLCRSLCAAVERLAEDLYESECHFIYELVQNAEDAHRRSDAQTMPTLRLKLGSSASYPEYFVSDNNEVGFSEADIQAICDISASSKRRQSDSGDTKEKVIGCKGIGFKSVFTVSDQPHVLSKGYTFKFDITGRLGKLGYVTPTWLSAEEVANLPTEVVEAHSAGRTVLFLPLKRRGLAASIGREMEELMGPGRATILFLQRLRTIELVPFGKPSSSLCQKGLENGSGYAAVVLEESQSPGESSRCCVREHQYLVHRHHIGQGAAAGWTLVLAFPLKADDNSPEGDSLEGNIRLEPLFCSLPIRAVGFGFAIHCDGFNLVANRGDLHHGSMVNRSIRDAVSDAYAAACTEHADVATRALALLGEPVADAFWRVAREGILSRLSTVACVQTDDATPCKPTSVLIKGTGKLKEAADLLPAALVHEACGRSFARTSSPAEERLLRRLGAEEFDLRHFCQCLAHQSPEHPQGWIAKLWLEGPRAAALSIIAIVYSCLGTMATGGPPHHDEPQHGRGVRPVQLDAVLNLPALDIFPLYGQGCSSLGGGRIFRSMTTEVSVRWQRILADGGVLRVLHQDVVDALDAAGEKLLEVLGITAAQRLDVVVTVVERNLQQALRGGDAALPASEKVRMTYWAGLGVLRDEWLKAPQDGNTPGPVIEKALTQVGLQGVKGKVPKLSLADVLLLPVRTASHSHWSNDVCSMLPPQKLHSPTLLGKQGTLPHDLVARVEAFLGIGSEDWVTSLAPGSASRTNSPEEVAATVGAAGVLGAPMERWPDDFNERPLAWEAFLVDGLGVQPLVPLDPRQPRAPPDLRLYLGATLGSDTDFGFWRTLLNEDMTSPRTFAYAIRRLQTPLDAQFLRQLPCRGGLTVQDLFLTSTYDPLVGPALREAYLNLPEAASFSGRGSQMLLALQSVGVHCKTDLHSILMAVIALVRKGCRDLAAYARLYAAAGTAEEEQSCDAFSAAMGVQQDAKVQLSRAIFHPQHKVLLKADQCIWSAHKCKLLAKCSPLVALEDVYAPFGSRRLEHYFVTCRNVQPRLCTATAYLGLLQSLWETAEHLGRLWRNVAPMGDSEPMVPLRVVGAAAAAQRSEEKVGALEFLDTVWEALLEVYRGMAALPSDERAALRPFSPLENLILVPLTCPEGGPPGTPSMCTVAHFFDGALFRRLPMAEAFWEVTPDLAHARIAEWALSSFFPTELRSLFVDDLGAREVVDVETLRQGLRSSAMPRGLHPRSGSNFGLHSGDAGGLQRARQQVNESGLPADALEGTGLGAGGDQNSSEAVHAGGSLRSAAEAALEHLRGSSGASSRSSSRRDAEDALRSTEQRVLLSAATPARSVRCPPTRAKQVVPHGTVSCEDDYDTAVSIYVVMDARPHAREGALENLLSARDIRRLNLGSLARTLVRLADRVFDIPVSRIAIAIDLPGTEDGGGGSCSHSLAGAPWNSQWPLLFAAKLRTQAGDEAEFWFGEFCHALAHRSLGPAHTAEHTWVQQVLMSQYMPKFQRAFRRR